MISTHVLDTSRGTPAPGVRVVLEMRSGAGWTTIGSRSTDADGRIAAFSEKPPAAGTYRLTFDTGTYHRDQGISHPFFPEAKVTFQVLEPKEHYHIPLLLSPFGYSTYRGT